MEFFSSKQGKFFCENVDLRSIASQVKTPCYVYSLAALTSQLLRFKNAFCGRDSLISFAIKANSNLSLLREIKSHGFGADIVSRGELERAILAGYQPDSIVFSGVGKTDEEIRRALELGIYCFNVESLPELELIIDVAYKLNRVAKISLRVNPDIDARTHPKISTGLYETKFGMDAKTALEAYATFKSAKSVKFIGLSCHIGSQILDLDPIAEAASSLAKTSHQLRALGAPLEFIGLGGGLGIQYRDEVAPSIEEYASVLKKETSHLGLKLVLEPGRVLVGNAGILLSRVLYVKTNPHKNFVIVDASMTELLRPALYDAYHEFEWIFEGADANQKSGEELYDVVGPVCESSDLLGRDRKIPVGVNSKSLVAIKSSGAYGFSMSSNYNSRPRPAEVLVDGDSFKVIRQSESLEDLWKHEL